VTSELLGPLAILFGFGVAIGVLVLWIWSIVDAAGRPSSQWALAGQSKALWLVVIVGVGVFGCVTFGWLGSLLYILVARPALKRAAAARPWPGAWPGAGI
jgi:hypothetical protein